MVENRPICYARHNGHGWTQDRARQTIGLPHFGNFYVLMFSGFCNLMQHSEVGFPLCLAGPVHYRIESMGFMG